MRRKKQSLQIEKVLAEFEKAERSTAHRKGTFKIDVPFEEALKIVAHAKPEPKRERQRQTGKKQGATT